MPARPWPRRWRARSPPIAAPNKKGIGRVVYTNMIPGGGFRGYGASQTTFAMECAIDELAQTARHRPVRDAAQERRAAGRQRRIDLEGAERRELRQLRHRPVPRHRRARAEEGQRRQEARRRRLARRHRRGARHARMRPADRAPLGGGDEAPARRHLPSRLRLVGDGQRHHHGAQADGRSRRRRARRRRRHHQCRHRPHALRHRHLRQHRHGRGRQGGAHHRRGDEATTSSTSPARHTGIAGRPVPPRQRCGDLRQQAHPAHRAACRGRQGQPSLHGRPQGLPVAAHHRLQRAGRAARGASRDRRGPHPAQRACRRHRTSDQSHAVPRPARRRRRHGLRLGADREHGP